MENQLAIAGQLKRIREQQGLSIRALAQDVSVVPETIRKIELGMTESPSSPTKKFCRMRRANLGVF